MQYKCNNRNNNIVYVRKYYVYCVNKMPFECTKCFADNMGITNGCNF